ncbi:two-partner secretion domain-containing protein [Moraxella nonliquefaciens]|uniref:two-partner secretion domain-containing protein n=1 Tax=Moraxella nonliquefaciens TaxID=478 RepID=UPI0018E179CB|nr:hemagglutinin repeat-containing protein [Moraxella nonliquefaciens]QQC29918.1 hemagglutinin repeat-containing protein [Moraxella nonliquefaciens]
MNHVYKTVFNKSKQTWMAVCEYARRVGCGSASGGSKSVTRGIVGSMTFLSFAVLMALQSAHANTPTTIIADKSADKALQPIVLNTASGVVSVNIATPNDKGLSNNHYRQFDVGGSGVILNNNRKAVSTQIAGFVAANPYMARGEASTILNQINSNHPSHLGGFIEVAGKKADVIIANPSGLLINGAGFINAGHVHLAAANSQVNQGQVTGYEVGTGHIAAHGKLNLQGTDYAALIAKAVQINDEIYAGDKLDVITGENQVSLQDGSFNQLSAVHQNNGVSSTSQQGVALDISNLGGMYAGKIHLIGTDKGFGVNNQGVITATGTLTLDSQGNLVNTGKILAKDAVTINTHRSTTQNNGTLLSEQADIAINTASLNNTGIIHSTQTAKIAAKEAIENRGSVYGGVLQVDTGKLNNTGQLIQTGTGKLDITTDTLINIDKAVIGQSLYGQTSIPTPSAPSSDQSAGSISNQPKDSTAGSTGNSSINPQSPANAGAAQSITVPNADGYIIATNRFNNTGDQALITATGDITITANQTSNTKQASIDAQSLNTNTLTNTDSKIALDEINWQLTSFDNTKGSITAKNGMVIGSESAIINTGGSLTSGTDITLVAKDRIINQDGIITAVKQADITANELQNGGAIQADAIAITQQLDHTHTDQDKLVANRLAFTTSGKLINQSQFTAGQTLTLNANHIDNTQAGIITSGNHTQITSQTDITNQGLINGDTTILKAKDTINNLAGGRLYGTHLAIQADTLNNTPAKAKDIDTHHTAPVIAARQRLDIGANHLNNNPNPDRAGKFNDSFDNQALITSLGGLNLGGSLDDNHHATGKAQTVVNQGATIESAGQMQVDTKTLLNTNADFKKHTVKVEAESVYGQTLYRNREQSGAAPVIQKSTDVADLGAKPMAGLFDCPDGSDCIMNYDNDSAIWAYFKIDAPKEPIPDIKAKDLLDEPEPPKDETAQSCALAGADNQACVQYNKDLANYTKVMGPLLTWEEDNAAAIAALELAIIAHNRQFNKNKSDVDLALNLYTTDEAYLGPTSRKGAPTGALYVKQENGRYHRVGEEIDEITVDFVVYEDKTLTSDPARMVAGQNLVIHGDALINDKSQMNAGAGFAVLGDRVIQTPDNGLYGEKTKVTENGRYVSRTVVSSGTGRRHKRVDIGSGAFVQSFAPLATYELPILNAAINTTPSSTSIDKPTTGNNLFAIINVQDSAINIPNSALYIINADDPNLPLIQTDPAFTDYKQWLGSDYMLKALQSDPNHIHKRLSDGYGEQARIKDQYYLLTGRHINTDYSSQEDAFKQLMDNGITHAKQFGYTLGTALTPDQMANLSTDIVWLVKESITHTTKDKDGNRLTKTEEVLTPKLYLRSANIAAGTLTPDGRYSTVSARNINMQLTGDLDNHGNIIAKDTAAITANNVNNTGTIYGNFVAVTADNTITNHGTLHANSAMSLDAKNRIINESQTTTQTNTQGRSSSSRSDISQIATISVGSGLKDKTDEQGSSLATLTIQAGNHILNKAANMQNTGGSTQMTAKNGIDIGTITTSNHISAVADDKNHFKYSQTQDVGSNISSYGDTIITTTAKNADINIQGSHLDSATGTTAIIGTEDVRMTEGRRTQSVESASQFTNRRLTGSKTEQSSFEQHSTTSIKNQVSGNQVVISGVNTTLVATEVLADKDILIKADKELLIGSAEDSLSRHRSQQTTKKGVFSTSPTSVTLGKQQTRQENSHEQTTYTGSLIGTTGGNIRLESGDKIDVINSDIIAQKDETDANTGNILFKAQAVNITSQNATAANTHSFAQKTTGVTASVSSSLVSDIQSIETLKDATQDTDSRRAKLMGGLAAASKVRTLNQNLQDGKLGSVRAQATISSQSTKSHSHSYQETNDAATIHTDGNLAFDVKGKGDDSTLTVTGSNISVGKDLYNQVESSVIYQASTQTSTTTSQNSSKGAGFGVYASANLSTDGLSSNSAGFTVNANKAKGSSHEIATTHTNTQVTVGGTTVNDIGGSLTLDGANLTTDHLTGTVGKDLIVKSRQDTYQYTHDQKQAGFSADVGFDGKPQSFSINGGKTDVDADYAQVTHQSGIKAKESTLSVQGQGKFTGGYLITDAGKNQTQFAQGIQTQDIENHLNYQGDAISVGIGVADTRSPNGKAKPALQGLGYGTITPTHKTSTTRTAITDQAGLSHINTGSFKQKEVQNQLNPIITNDFNKEQALKELNAQVVITTEFGKEAPKAVADFADKQAFKLIQNLDELNNKNIDTTSDEYQNTIKEIDKWSEGGIYRVALHTAVAALATGTIEGAATTGAVAGVAPRLNEIQDKLTEKLIEQGLDKNTAESMSNSVLSLAIAGVGAGTGLDTSSIAYAVNADAFNRQLHANKGRIGLLKSFTKDRAAIKNGQKSKLLML